MELSEIANFLNSSGQTILGAFIGAGAVVIGQMVNARASRKASELLLEATRESNQASATIAESAAVVQMKAALVSATLDAYREFDSLMTEWEVSVRDENTLGHSEVPKNDEYAGWVLSEKWKSAHILGKLAAVTSGPLPNNAASVREAGIKALQAHETNFYLRDAAEQDTRYRAAQERTDAVENFREKLAELPKSLRQALQIDKNQNMQEGER